MTTTTVMEIDGTITTRVLDIDSGKSCHVSDFVTTHGSQAKTYGCRGL